MTAKLKPFFNIAKIAFPILVIIVIYVEGKKELAGISIKESFKAIKGLHSGGFLLVVLLGIAAIATMFFYDDVMIRSLNVDVPFRKIFRVSWIANTFNGVIGFGGLAGAGLRAMLYREEVKDDIQLLKGIAWMTPSMINGLSILLLFAIVGIIPTGAVLRTEQWLWAVVIGIVLVVPVYLLFPKFNPSPLKLR